MDINIAVTDANNITLEVTPTPTQTITIDRGIAGPQGPTGPAGGGATSVSVVSANGLAGTVANPTTTPAITLSTTVTGIVKGNGTALSAATAGTDYAPATSGSSILYGDSAGGFNNVTVGSGLSFAAGTLAATGGSSGDVIGPASSTNKAIVTFDGTTGKLIQNNSGNTIGTTGNTVIEVTDNINAALRITQLGTGNALVVEDETNPDATPFVIDAIGQVGIGVTIPEVTGITMAVNGNTWVRSKSFAGLALFSGYKANGTISIPTIVVNGDEILRFDARGYDGANYIRAASIETYVDGTPGTNDMPGRLVFSTTADGASSPTERMRIDSAGRVGIGGSAPTGSMIWNIKSITGAATSIAYDAVGTIQSDVTNSATGYRTNLTTQATSFTLAGLRHFQAAQSTIGVGSIVTNQYGFVAESSLTGATNNYGFYGNIASGTGRYNLYMNGTADNYMAGRLGIGNTSPGQPLDITSVDFGVRIARFSTSNISPGIDFRKSASATVGVNTLVASNDNLGRIIFSGADGTNFTVAAEIQASVDGTPGLNDMPGRLTFATTADGASTTTERMRINSAGNVGIGVGISQNDTVFTVSKNMTGATTTYGIRNISTVQSDSTTSANSFQSAINTAASAFTVTNLRQFFASQGTIGAGSSVTNQFGYLADASLIGATNNYGFYGNIASGTNRWNLYMNGTAANYLGGQLQLGQDYIEKTNVANTSTAITLDLTNGTFQVLTLTGSPTITMPTAVAGKSFVILLKTGTGSFTVTWSTVKWPGGTAPTITSTASKQDIFSFFSDGINWYGTVVGQNYTP